MTPSPSPHPRPSPESEDRRVICWFSAGAASAVATHIALRELDRERVVIAYCETGSEHPDNERFIADCERWFNAHITRLRSSEYTDTWDVWTRRKYLAGHAGAPCTTELKIAPRLAFQRPYDEHVFGYTADANDARRAEKLRANYPELIIRTPLIEAGLTKAACLSLIQAAGIKPPALYALGYPNNNCLPCVKAQSPDYWALVRKTHPVEFSRMVNLSRALGVRLAKIKEERVFIDEIPADWPTMNPIAPGCDFLCHIAEQDMKEAAQ